MRGCLHDPRTNPTPADLAEVHKFRTFIKCEKAYGMSALLRRRYWREYLGVTDDEYQQWRDKGRPLLR